MVAELVLFFNRITEPIAGKQRVLPSRKKDNVKKKERVITIAHLMSAAQEIFKTTRFLFGHNNSVLCLKYGGRRTISLFIYRAAVDHNDLCWDLQYLLDAYSEDGFGGCRRNRTFLRRVSFLRRNTRSVSQRNDEHTKLLLLLELKNRYILQFLNPVLTITICNNCSSRFNNTRYISVFAIELYSTSLFSTRDQNQ